MQISVFDSSGLAIKAPNEHGPGDSAVQTLFIEWKRPEWAGDNVLDTRRTLDIRVRHDRAWIELRGFDVEQPEPFKLEVAPRWTEAAKDPPTFPRPGPPAFRPPSSYQVIVEAVFAAAGEHEPVFYTKWFAVDNLERYIYHRKPDGSVEFLGRMYIVGDRYAVEMPMETEPRDFDRVYEAEDYVSHLFATSIPAGS